MRRTILVAAFAAIISVPAFADPHNVYGTWVTQAGNSHVEIADCGDGTPCGTVVWIDPEALPAGEAPETVTDANGDKVLGLKMLHSFDKKKKDWRAGTIYDPEVGKSYGSQIKLRADGTLQVKGCIGPFCQTQIWQKAPEAELVSDS